METGVQPMKSPAASRVFSHPTTASFRCSHSTMTSLSSRYFGIPATPPPRGPIRLPQSAEPAGVDVVSVGPDAGEAVDDGAAVARSPLAILGRHGIADQPRHRCPAPPALGRQEPGSLLVEIELGALHRVMYDIYHPVTPSDTAGDAAAHGTPR